MRGDLQKKFPRIRPCCLLQYTHGAAIFTTRAAAWVRGPGSVVTRWRGKRKGRWGGESRVFERAERGSGHGRGPALWWGNKGTRMNV